MKMQMFNEFIANAALLFLCSAAEVLQPWVCWPAMGVALGPI